MRRHQSSSTRPIGRLMICDLSGNICNLGLPGQRNSPSSSIPFSPLTKDAADVPRRFTQFRVAQPTALPLLTLCWICGSSYSGPKRVAGLP
jgi:hypothetical protein